MKYPSIRRPHFLSILGQVLRMGLAVSPWRFALFALYNIANGILTGLYAPALQRLIDTSTAAGATYAAALSSLMLFAALLIGQHVINGVDHAISSDLHLKIRGDAMERLLHKAGKLPAQWYENADFLTHLEKAKEGTRYDWTFLIPLLRFFVTYLPATLVMGSYLYTQKPSLIYLLALVYAPAALGYFLHMGIWIKLEDTTAPIRRERDHYRDCITRPEYFRETRILGAFGFFLRKWTDATQRLAGHTRSSHRKANGIEIMISIAKLLGYAGAILLLVDALLKGEITPGAFAAIFATLGYFVMLADETLGHMLAPLDGAGTVGNFISFLRLPDAAPPSLNLGTGIHAKDLRYRYESSPTNAVDGVSLDIAAGETIAIVGLNGSGKTTLVRMLTGIYPPDSGELTVGGRVTGIFQKYQRYHMTLRENIAISDTGRAGEDEEMARCLSDAGFSPEMDLFAQGLDTMLSREFDGIDVSGGQWQRIAIARGLFRTHDVVVLDEPTAAIDPLEESKLYQDFARLVQGKTAILVTHRLGSARIADRIIVMDRGKINDVGTHEELMQRGGVYSEMVRAQMQWYV